MKKLVIVVLAACMAVSALAQSQGDKKWGKPDFEKIKAEKVAFITSEVGLTSKEAEAFWPIYNRIEEEQHALIKAERQAYKALSEAIAAGTDTKAALDAYIKAKEANVNLQIRGAKDYGKVLSAEKVAKFYTCEEKFLRSQLGKLGGRHGHNERMNGGFHRGQQRGLPHGARKDAKPEAGK